MDGFINASDCKYFELLPRLFKEYFRKTVKEEGSEANTRLSYLLFDLTEAPVTMNVVGYNIMVETEKERNHTSSVEVAANSNNSNSSPENGSDSGTDQVQTSPVDTLEESEDLIPNDRLQAVSPEEKAAIAQDIYPQVFAYIRLQATKYIDTVVSMMITHFLINASGDSTFNGIESREFLWEAKKIEKYIMENVTLPIVESGNPNTIADYLTIDSDHQRKYEESETKYELLLNAQSELQNI